jgi:hypothetical protein
MKAFEVKPLSKRLYGCERNPRTDEEWFAYWNLIPNFNTKKERLEYIRRKIKEAKEK